MCIKKIVIHVRLNLFSVSDFDKSEVNMKAKARTIPYLTTTQVINIDKYVEEKPAQLGNIAQEMARLRRFLATQGTICQDIRRIGGEHSHTWLAPRPFGADGAWDVCFDKDVGLAPGSCIVYSFG
jgi:hypothetical protein